MASMDEWGFELSYLTGIFKLVFLQWGLGGGGLEWRLRRLSGAEIGGQHSRDLDLAPTYVVNARCPCSHV